MKFKGAMIASAVATMFAAGAAMAGDAPKADAKAGGVKCSGANSCSGKGACKTAKNACAGKNGCKGQGWVMEKDDAACKAKGGSVEK